MLTLGMLSSHRGSNTRAVVEACQSGQLAATPGIIISNNPKAGVLQLAADKGVPARRIGGKALSDPQVRDQAMLSALKEHGVDLVLLLGYMRLLGPRTIDAYRGRILNIHPALLPKYGGQGMYGMAVHEAVLAAGEAQTGVTIHLVDEQYDHGAILAQTTVPVLEGDDATRLAARVLAREHSFLVETLQAIVRGELELP